MLVVVEVVLVGVVLVGTVMVVGEVVGEVAGAVLVVAVTVGMMLVGSVVVVNFHSFQLKLTIYKTLYHSKLSTFPIFNLQLSTNSSIVKLRFCIIFIMSRFVPCTVKFVQ